MLYPINSETREVRELGGYWNFKTDPAEVGRTEEWFCRPLEKTIPMFVPASYNDQTQSAELRNYVGIVWYEQTFFVPAVWQAQRTVLRFGSVTHHAKVWINGIPVAQHKGGFLPFEADISKHITFKAENRVTVEVANRLDWSCLPPGFVDTKGPESWPPWPCKEKVQQYAFDFFNYAGIHRPVRLCSIPKTSIEDITVVTDINDTTGIIDYSIEANGSVEISVLDHSGSEVATGIGASGRIEISNAHFWEPGEGYLYTFAVRLKENDALLDVYRLPTGIRTVKIEDGKFLINGRPFYFKGFGKHEDSVFRGRGINEAQTLMDFNVMKSMGANSFRTAHYPYAEETMRLADEMGLVVIDETPAVGMYSINPDDPWFTDGKIDDRTLAHHKEVMRDLIKRDKNHACVAVWCIANEAGTREEGAEPYFKELIELTRELDPRRPLTVVHASDRHAIDCRVSHLVDIVCINRYFGWYQDNGRLEPVEYQLELDLQHVYEKFGKPVFMTEYGADTIDGFHANTPRAFSEEYQWDYLEAYSNVFDRLPFLVGEHVWNFADFDTKQAPMRVMGNRKGVFTRERAPKSCVRFLRQRWNSSGVSERPATAGAPPRYLKQSEQTAQQQNKEMIANDKWIGM